MVLILKINEAGRDTPEEKIRDFYFVKDFLTRSWPESLKVETMDPENILAALVQGRNVIDHIYNILK